MVKYSRQKKNQSLEQLKHNNPKFKALKAAYFIDLNASRQNQTLLESALETRAQGGESLLDVLGIKY